MSLPDNLRSSQKRKNYALLGALVALIVLLYAISIMRMGSDGG